MEKISLKEFGEQFHLSEKYISLDILRNIFILHFLQYITHLRLEHTKQLLKRYGYSCYRSCNAEWISEYKLFYPELQKRIWEFLR